MARTIDQDIQHMTKTLAAADAHRGTSFIEILQNCVIFNKDFYAANVERKVRADRTIDLVPGEPMIYGKERDKGLRFNGFEIERCAADEADVWRADTKSTAPAVILAGMRDDPEMPVPVGLFRSVEAPNYEIGVNAQVDEAVAAKGAGALEDLADDGDKFYLIEDGTVDVFVQPDEAKVGGEAAERGTRYGGAPRSSIQRPRRRW